MADSTYSTDPFSSRNPGTMRSRISGIGASLRSTNIGRGAIGGFSESLGFYVPGMGGQAPGSFLGLSESLGEMSISNNKFKSALRSTEKLVWQGRFGAASRNIGRETMRGARSLGYKGMTRLAGKTLWKSIPVLGTAWMAYSGYQENGVSGAIGGVGESMLYSAVPRIAIGALSTSAGVLAAVPLALGAVGLGAYSLGEAGIEHAKGLKDTEFISRGAIDALGSVGAATGRQRSMMALNNTHINGRMAMGNEAILMHGDRTTGRF